MADNTWAVLVCTSTFWFNYRHVSNALSVYQIVRGLGVPPERVLLMLGDDVACSPRNAAPGAVYRHPDHAADVYAALGCGAEDGAAPGVAFRGPAVTVANLLRLLTDRQGPDAPASRRLRTDADSRLLLYMTGHGGDNFLKFRDREELSSAELAEALRDMAAAGRFREALLVTDTCQASTLYDAVDTPGILALASSLRDESSYSHHIDASLGVAILDRFTTALLHATRDMVRPPTVVAVRGTDVRTPLAHPPLPLANALSVQAFYDGIDTRMLSSHAFITNTPLLGGGSARDRLFTDFVSFAHRLYPLVPVEPVLAAPIVPWPCAATRRSPGAASHRPITFRTSAEAPAFSNAELMALVAFLVVAVFVVLRSRT